MVNLFRSVLFAAVALVGSSVACPIKTTSTAPAPTGTPEPVPAPAEPTPEPGPAPVPIPEPEPAVISSPPQISVGEAHSMGTGTYPRVTRLADGSLLGALSFGDNGDQVISTVTSIDGGVTWTPLGEVTRGQGDISNQYPLQLPSGKFHGSLR